jgi:hypothetical protein
MQSEDEAVGTIAASMMKMTLACLWNHRYDVMKSLMTSFQGPPVQEG